jgi:tRNA(adenine34) deaminase
MPTLYPRDNPLPYAYFMPATDRDQWEAWMRDALQVAIRASRSGDVPVGALVMSPDGELVASGHNTRQRDNDPAGHAEIVALRAAGKAVGSPRLDDYTLVVTLEPCVMCAGAIAQAGISRLIYGAWDPKAGAAGGGPHDLVRDRSLPHRVNEVIGGVLTAECSALLEVFFTGLRDMDKPL